MNFYMIVETTARHEDGKVFRTRLHNVGGTVGVFVTCDLEEAQDLRKRLEAAAEHNKQFSSRMSFPDIVAYHIVRLVEAYI